MPVQSKLEKQEIARGAIRGVKKRFGGFAGVMIHGKKYTPAEIVAFYEKHLAAMEDIRKTWIAWQLAIRAERALRRPAATMTLGLRTVVRQQFGLEAYADFSWPKPKKPGPKTVRAKLAGVQKRAKKRQAT
jgi:hypothetical protein